MVPVRSQRTRKQENEENREKLKHERKPQMQNVPSSKTARAREIFQLIIKNVVA